jgi:hypothetical protein
VQLVLLPDQLLVAVIAVHQVHLELYQYFESQLDPDIVIDKSLNYYNFCIILVCLCFLSLKYCLAGLFSVHLLISNVYDEELKFMMTI